MINSSNKRFRPERLQDPIRVLYVIGSLDIGGTEKQLHLLLKYLNRKWFKPRVMALSPGGMWVDRIRDLGIRVVELERNGHWEMRRLQVLRREAMRWAPRIIHSFQRPANLYARLATLGIKGTRMIASYRSFDFSRWVSFFWDLMAYRSSDAVVCNSLSLEGHLKDRYGSGIRAVTIYNGIEKDRSFASDQNLRASFGLSPNAPVVGTVGRLVPVKNHDLFLKIAKRISSQLPHARFLIVGDGPLEGELRKRAAHLGMKEKVIFSGRSDDVEKILPLFQVFLMTTSNGNGQGEGFPNAVMEAMLMGVPCVSVRGGGIGEMIVSGENGYLVEPGSIDGVAEKVVDLLQDQRQRRVMGEQAHRMTMDRYDPERMARKYEDLYIDLVRGNGAFL